MEDDLSCLIEDDLKWKNASIVGNGGKNRYLKLLCKNCTIFRLGRPKLPKKFFRLLDSKLLTLTI